MWDLNSHYLSGIGHKILSKVKINSYLDSMVKIENIKYKKQKSIEKDRLPTKN